MKPRPFLIAGGIGSILIFTPPMAALILVYVSPAIFTAPLAILCRWLAVQMVILFMVGIIYAAAADGTAASAENRRPIVSGAAWTAFIVGLVGTASEIIARIIPEILVALDVIGYTYVPLNVALLPVLCIVFTVFSALGAGVGAAGATVYMRLRNKQPSG
jgi:hypothetical protein